jgi:hypothetical protein
LKEYVVTTKSKEEKTQISENMLKTVQDVLSLFLSLGTLLSISGFIVVNSYLSIYTRVSYFSRIESLRYIVAGVPVIIVALTVLGIFVGVLAAAVSIRQKRPINWGSLTDVLQYITKDWISYLVTALIVFTASRFYGLNWYGLVPFYLGGGSSSDVMIVLEDATTLMELGFQPYQPLSNRTNSVYLLMKLTDGILVFDQVSNRTIAIQDSVIKGLLSYDNMNLINNQLLPTFTATADTIAVTPEVTVSLGP